MLTPIQEKNNAVFIHAIKNNISLAMLCFNEDLYSLFLCNGADETRIILDLIDINGNQKLKLSAIDRFYQVVEANGEELTLGKDELIEYVNQGYIFAFNSMECFADEYTYGTFDGINSYAIEMNADVLQNFKAYLVCSLGLYLNIQNKEALCSFANRLLVTIKEMQGGYNDLVYKHRADEVCFSTACGFSTNHSLCEQTRLYSTINLTLQNYWRINKVAFEVRFGIFNEYNHDELRATICFTVNEIATICFDE